VNVIRIIQGQRPPDTRPGLQADSLSRAMAVHAPVGGILPPVRRNCSSTFESSATLQGRPAAIAVVWALVYEALASAAILCWYTLSNVSGGRSDGYSWWAPGWYTDPADPMWQRYWDGTAWTMRRRPLPPPSEPSREPATSWPKRITEWFDAGTAAARFAKAVVGVQPSRVGESRSAR
jgi:hypothetical protein